MSGINMKGAGLVSGINMKGAGLSEQYLKDLGNWAAPSLTSSDGSTLTWFGLDH